MSVIPVITLDGLSGSGKGTYSMMLARHLKWNYLDSGALYRAVAWAVLHYGVDCKDLTKLHALLGRIDIVMECSPCDDHFKVLCDHRDITQDIRNEDVGSAASECARIQIVRDYCLGLNRDSRRCPGLVADGRDMGTIVFPDAEIKFYLEAPAKIRAERRYLQLKQKGLSVSLHAILNELIERDGRDQNRELAPAVPASDVTIIDTTDKTIDQVFEELLFEIKNRIPSL